MGKMVGMAEFKSNCTRLLREVQAGGEPLTVTVRGKPVAVVSPPAPKGKLKSAFGLFKSDKYRFDIEPEESALDPDWEEQWEAKWTERGFPGPNDKK